MATKSRISEAEIDGVSNNDLATWLRALYGPKTLEIHFVEKQETSMLPETENKYPLLIGLEQLSSTMLLILPSPCTLTSAALRRRIILSGTKNTQSSKGPESHSHWHGYVTNTGEGETQTFTALLDSDSQVTILSSPLGKVGVWIQLMVFEQSLQ